MTQTPTSATWRSVERISIVAPLGIRFWDPAFDVPVIDGLTVTAYPAGRRWPPTSAYQTPNGIYAFRDLPGLRDVEYPSGNPAGPGSLPAVARFRIEVSDAASRFLPVTFFADTPHSGIFLASLPPVSTVPYPQGFYLFSAPTRPATPVTALVRAQVSERLDAINERPAAYAVMEIDTPAGDTWFGLADDRGIVTALFPYPTFTGTSGAASLPPAAGAPQQNWPITLSIRYQPSVLSFPDGSSQPDLRTILAQAPASIWTQRASPPGESLSSLSATLVFGQGLTMRSTQESVLLVSLGSMP